MIIHMMSIEVIKISLKGKLLRETIAILELQCKNQLSEERPQVVKVAVFLKIWISVEEKCSKLNRNKSQNRGWDREEIFKIRLFKTRVIDKIKVNNRDSLKDKINKKSWEKVKEELEVEKLWDSTHKTKFKILQKNLLFLLRKQRQKKEFFQFKIPQEIHFKLKLKFLRTFLHSKSFK